VTSKPPGFRYSRRVQFSETPCGAIQPVIREAFFGKQIRIIEKPVECFRDQLGSARVRLEFLFDELVVQILDEGVLRDFIRISGRFGFSLGFWCSGLSFLEFD